MLLAKYELEGKIRRVDYVPPEDEEEEDEHPERIKQREDEVDLGDGNVWRKPEEPS